MLYFYFWQSDQQRPITVTLSTFALLLGVENRFEVNNDPLILNFKNKNCKSEMSFHISFIPIISTVGSRISLYGIGLCRILNQRKKKPAWWSYQQLWCLYRTSCIFNILMLSLYILTFHIFIVLHNLQKYFLAHIFS